MITMGSLGISLVDMDSLSISMLDIEELIDMRPSRSIFIDRLIEYSHHQDANIEAKNAIQKILREIAIVYIAHRVSLR